MSTRADRRDGRWVLNGTKQWITSGDRAGVLIVWARTDVGAGNRGITAFLVEGGTPGLVVGRHEDKMGIRSSSTVSLTFEDCAVPASAVLGEVGHGLRVALAALDGGRIGIASQATGTIRAALDASTRYAKERHAFGKPIAEFQAIAFALADMRTAHDAARLMTLRAAALKEAGRPFGQEAAMAKLFASEAAQARHVEGRPDPRRVWVHRRVPRRAPVPGRPRADHLRGHERDPAAGHRPPRPLPRRVTRGRAWNRPLHPGRRAISQCGAWNGC